MSNIIFLPWPDELDAFTLALHAAGRARQTVELRRYHLERLARWARPRGLGPWSLTLDDLLTWTGAQRWSSETRRSYRASLRAFWRWGVLTGRTTHDVAAGLPSIPPAQPQPRPAPPEAVVTALHEADRLTWLMIRLGVELGMRRGEVAQVHSDDLLRDLTGWSLRVHGKGGKLRVIPLPDSLARALRRLPAGYAFPGNDGGHLSPRWVGKRVSRMLPAGVTMHQLRHLCATEVHEETRDMRLVQELLGHASIATTQRYVKVNDDRMRAAVADRSARWSA